MPGNGMPNLEQMSWTDAQFGLNGQSFNPLVQMQMTGSFNPSLVGTYGAAQQQHGMSKIVQTQTQQAEAGDDAEAKRYVGRIRKFQGMTGGHGFGFIDCPEIRNRTGADVYVHAKQTMDATWAKKSASQWCLIPKVSRKPAIW